MPALLYEQIPSMAKVRVGPIGSWKKWLTETLGSEVGICWIWALKEKEPPTPEIPPEFQNFSPRRVVERTFGQLRWNRRLPKDYEFLPETADTFVYLGKDTMLASTCASFHNSSPI